MTIQELDKKFYFHDSVINNIKYAAEEKKTGNFNGALLLGAGMV